MKFCCSGTDESRKTSNACVLVVTAALVCLLLMSELRLPLLVLSQCSSSPLLLLLLLVSLPVSVCLRSHFVFTLSDGLCLRRRSFETLISQSLAVGSQMDTTGWFQAR